MGGEQALPFSFRDEKEARQRLSAKKNIMVVTDETVTMELVKNGQGGACILRKENTKELIDSGLVHHHSEIDFEIPLSIAFLANRRKEPLIEATVTLIQGVFVDKP